MTGKFVAYVLSIGAFFYIVLICLSFFIYMATSERVNDICYDAAETISTRGYLSQDVLSYIKGNLSCYGEYQINFTLEKRIGERAVYYHGEEQIAEKVLSKGDRVIISATGENPTLFEKITGADMNIATVKVAIVN